MSFEFIVKNSESKVNGIIGIFLLFCNIYM